MAQFRKKPVVIEAVQYPCEHPALRRCDCDPNWPNSDGPSPPAVCSECGHEFIETLEGRMRVSPGDWIITGVQGEHYPCKPDIFAATYEPADSADPGDDVERRARELLAEEYKRIGGIREGNSILRDGSRIDPFDLASIRAITAALSAPKQEVAEDDALYRMFRAIVDAGGPSIIARHGVERGGDEWASAVRAGLLAIELRFHPERFDYFSPQPAPQPVVAEGREVTVSVGGLMNVPAERAAQQMRENAKVMETRHRFLQGSHGGKGDPTDGHIANLLRAGADALDRLVATPPPEKPVESEGRQAVAEVTHNKPDNYSANHRVRWLTQAVIPVGTKLYTTTQPEQPAIDLEQFRPAVEALIWIYKKAGCMEDGAVMAEATQLLAIIDGAKGES